MVVKIREARPESLKIPRAVTHLRLDEVVPSRLRSISDDAEPFESIKSSIHINGLLHPIVVRPLGDKYEIVGGHRRFASFNQLAAEFPNEKRFKRIAARIADIDDDLVPVVQLADDLNDTELSVLEIGDVITNAIAHGLSHELIMHVLGWQRQRLNRYLQIQNAPVWLRRCAITVQVPVHGVDEEGKPTVRHAAMAGLSFTKMFELVTLYNVLGRADLAELVKEPSDRPAVRARPVVEGLIHRCAFEEWNTAQLRAAIALVKAPDTPQDAGVLVRPPMSVKRGKCVIDLGRAGSMTTEERAQLARDLTRVLDVFAFKELLITA